MTVINQGRDGTMRTILTSLIVLLFCLPTFSQAEEELIKGPSWTIPLEEYPVVPAQCLEAMEKGLLVQTGTGLGDGIGLSNSYFWYEGVVYRIRFSSIHLVCKSSIPSLTEAR